MKIVGSRKFDIVSYDNNFSTYIYKKNIKILIINIADLTEKVKLNQFLKNERSIKSILLIRIYTEHYPVQMSERLSLSMYSWNIQKRVCSTLGSHQKQKKCTQKMYFWKF